MFLKSRLIDTTVVTQFAQCHTVDAHHVQHFFQYVKYSVWESEVAERSKCRFPEKLGDFSTIQIVHEELL
jgi:hypothetical protein